MFILYIHAIYFQTPIALDLTAYLGVVDEKFKGIPRQNPHFINMVYRKLCCRNFVFTFSPYPHFRTQLEQPQKENTFIFSFWKTS